MPVLLEHLKHPSDLDWQDIEKIHQDTASDGLTLDRNQLDLWLAKGGWIMAGRFNDRLIGALLAIETPEGIELSHAGVRKLTQKRGVMHQLLHFICTWAQQNNKKLIVKPANELLQQSLLKRGFQKVDGYCYYLAQPL